MKYLRCIVTGGRDYADRYHVYTVLDRVVREDGFLTVVEGGASGADLIAYEWGVARGYDVLTFVANWKKHGKAAGPIRNAEMIEACKDMATVVVAFPGGRGTADMVRQSTRAGLTVIDERRVEDAK